MFVVRRLSSQHISPLHLALVDKLAKTKSAEEVHRLIGMAPANLLNAGTCSTALRQLGKFSSTTTTTTTTATTTVDRLVAACEPLKLKPDQLRDCLFGLTQLNTTTTPSTTPPLVPKSMLEKTLVGSAASPLSVFTGEDLALLVDALPHTDQFSAQVLARVGQEVCSRKSLKDFKPNELGVILHRFLEEEDDKSAPLFTHIGREICKRKHLKDFAGDDFGLILQSYAQFASTAAVGGVSEQVPHIVFEVFDKAAKFLVRYPDVLQQPEVFRAEDLSSVLQSFREVQFGEWEEASSSSPRILPRLVKRVAEAVLQRKAHEFSAYDLAVVLHAVTTTSSMQEDDLSSSKVAILLGERVAEEIVARLDGSSSSGDEFEVEEVASLLASLARLDVDSSLTGCAQRLFESVVLARDLQEVDSSLLESIHDSLHLLGVDVDKLVGGGDDGGEAKI